MRTKADLGNGRKRTNLRHDKEKRDALIVEMLNKLIGEKQKVVISLQQYAAFLVGALQSPSVTPETAALLEWEYWVTANRSQNIAAQVKMLESFCAGSPKSTNVSGQSDMFGGMGHFDINGEYHFGE